MEQITAQQAAEMADQKNAASQLEEVYKSIDILARQGMYQVYSDRLLFPDEVWELERMGYRVEIPTIGKCHKIMWSKIPVKIEVNLTPQTEVIGTLVTEPG